MIQQPIMQSGPNIIEMAKKKRHLSLLSKLQSGGTLGPNEIKELSTFEGPGEESQWILNTQLDVAKFFKVRRRTVERWVAESMPTREDGRYDIRAIYLWRETREKQKKLPFDKKINWEDIKEEYQAKIKKLEYEKLVGDVIPKEEVERERVARIIAVKRKLLSLPRALALQLVGLDPREIEVRLNERIGEIIDAFAGNAEIKTKGPTKKTVKKSKPETKSKQKLSRKKKKRKKKKAKKNRKKNAPLHKATADKEKPKKGGNNDTRQN